MSLISDPFEVTVTYRDVGYLALRRAYDFVDPLYQTRSPVPVDPGLVLTGRQTVRLCYVYPGRVVRKMHVLSIMANEGIRPPVFVETYECGRVRPNDQRDFPIIGFGSQIRVNRGFLVPCLGTVRRKGTGKKGGWVRNCGLVRADVEYGQHSRFLGVFLE